MRRANKKDQSHGGIVDGLRQRGVVVIDMPDPGDVLTFRTAADVLASLKATLKARGCNPELNYFHVTMDDLIAVVAHTQIWTPLEAKTPGMAVEKPSQKKRRLGYRLNATRADGSRYTIELPPHPIPVVFTIEDALTVLGIA